MRCTNCGLPLSPSNTSLNCPRCHIALVSGAKPVAVYSAFPGVAQTPFPQAGQMWPSDSLPSPLPTPEPMEAAVRDNNASDMRNGRKAGTLPGGQAKMYSNLTPVTQSHTRGTSNLGLIVAGLCVLTGGLILVFVYFMSLGLPAASTTNAYNATPTTISNTLPTATAAPSVTVMPSTTVGAFPGQQYIDNGQMASLVNTNTAQPLQTTTKFKVNQRIYVTFNIHPNGKSGAVCLIWYLNSRVVTQYPFAVSTTANAGYSYALYGGAGNGYVEIYWASSTICSDKILAQKVNFTVTH